ncbi:MAG: hypothetical protein K2X66_04845, partial [Cyanobacteria bacterium]|nr:hypothetical protein [Cyanobacteriota bacterium]
VEPPLHLHKDSTEKQANALLDSETLGLNQVPPLERNNTKQVQEATKEIDQDGPIQEVLNQEDFPL